MIVKKIIVHCLGTNQARPKRMNFRKTSKGGRGVIFNPKINAADFGLLSRAFSGNKLQNNFPKMRVERSKAVWSFSKKSSVLVA